MDDFNVSSLHESKNEWVARLITILTPLIIEGLRSIFEETIKICKENNEMEKYLMSYQNFISRIPKWNPNIIEQECKRIIERSGCNYLEELITCVHIIQLKLLTAIRVGQKQKKIDINIPKLNDFIHKTYIFVARKIYKNVYLFEINVAPLQTQKNNRELELIVQECILNAIRESIPVENILKAYMEETIEEDVTEEIKEQEIIVENDKLPNDIISNNNSNTNILENKSFDNSKLSFNNIDMVRDINNNEEIVNASKDIDVLEEISNIRNIQRRVDSEDDNVRLKISDENYDLVNIDMNDLNNSEISLIPDLIDDIEILA